MNKRKPVKRINKKTERPEWIKQFIKILRPPEKLTVSEWADKYRILDSRTSAEPGRWKTSRTPYLEGVMNAFIDPEVEEVTFIKPTQCGGTEALNNIIGYLICQDQSPALIVYPTLDLAEHVSKNRLQPMIKLSPEINQHFKVDDSKLLELQFDGMILILSGANSPASLSSRPVRYVLIDELDKLPKFSGKEANPESLAKERQRTFSTNKKTYKTSTPTLKGSPAWQAWENSDSQYKYYVPCPHCGHFQTLKFKKGIKWSEKAQTAEEVREAAYYECESCKQAIYDVHKPQMLREGEWRAEKNGGKTKIAFHLNAIYSPWVRFGDIAYEFKKSKDYPELLMNFINSVLAEPWEQTEIKLSYEKVLERQTGVEEGIIPNEAIILTGGIDVQRGGFYFTIRAWGEAMTSWNIVHGYTTDWSNVEYIMTQPYSKENGEKMYLNLAAIDSGDQTDDVYDLCVQNQEWLIPVKGSSTPILSKYKISKIDKVGSMACGMNLYLVDPNPYKDMIAGRMQRPNGKGSWMVYKDCDADYANQICAEEKVLEKRGGREFYIWKPKSAGADNHYLDCEVYGSLAADLCHVRYLQAQKPPVRELKQEEPKQNNWISNDSNWLGNNNGSWL